MKKEALEKLIDDEMAKTTDKLIKLEQEKRKEELIRQYTGDDKIVSWQEIADKLSKEKPEPPMSTGYQRLDYITKGGFGRKQLIALTGITKNGKTAFAMQLTKNMEQYAPLWFPFEETAEELIKKQLDYGAKIPLAYSPMSFPTEDLNWVEERIVEAIIKFGTKIVLIDHLHFLVKSFGEKERLDLKMTEIVSQLKRIAKRLDVCIVLVVHLRKVAIHEQPTINDIKETSSIAQWADKTLIVWREAVKSPSGILEYSNTTYVTLAADRQSGNMESIPFTFHKGVYTEGESKQEADETLMGTFTKEKDYGKI
jgi:replicative DNA helicase